MEITSSAEKLAQDWKIKIKDWNLNAALKAGTVLADGKTVLPRHGQGFYDHGANFGVLGEQKFRMAMSEVRKLHKDANMLAVFPMVIGDVILYQFRNHVTADGQDKRGGVYPASAYFLVDSRMGQKFVDQVQSEPSLADALVVAKFPVFRSEVKVEDWKKLLYLPQDLFIPTINDQIKVLATR